MMRRRVLEWLRVEGLRLGKRNKSWIRGLGIETLVDFATLKRAFKGINLRTYLEIAELGELFAALVETA
jgi:hypothetical protein